MTAEVTVRTEVAEQAGVVPMHERAVLTILARPLVRTLRAEEACATLTLAPHFDNTAGS